MTRSLHVCAFASLLLASATMAEAQVTGVNFSGNTATYGTANKNGLTTGPSPNSDTGDFDFGMGTTDSRSSRPYDSRFLDFTSNSTSTTENLVFQAGAQIVNKNSSVTPAFPNFYRYVNSGIFQAGNAVGQSSESLAFLPNVNKSQFLGGAAAFGAVGFANQAGSMMLTVATLSTGSSARFFVENGSSFYVSQDAVTATNGALTLNAATSLWYVYSPSTNLLFNTGSPGNTVSGSTFTNIQAFGVLAQTLDFDGTAAAAGNLQIKSFSASFISEVPEPGTTGLIFGLASFAVLACKRMRAS